MFLDQLNRTIFLFYLFVCGREGRHIYIYRERERQRHTDTEGWTERGEIGFECALKQMS